MVMHRLRQMGLALMWQRQVRAAISTQLSLLEGDGLFAIGGLTAEEEEALGTWVHGCAEEGGGAAANGQAGPIVEFGTLFGLTTLLLSQCKPCGMRVITVDNFCWNPFGLSPELHRGFTRRVLRAAIAAGGVELVDADSRSFRERYRGPVPRLVFLDADHSYEAVKDEIAWAKGLGVPVICRHDYGNPRFGVTRAVDESFPAGVQTRGMLWVSAATEWPQRGV